MSVKSQYKNAKRNLNKGFLLIECLIGLMAACWLMLLIAIAQNKIIEGQMQIRTQFELLGHAGNALHRLMSGAMSVSLQDQTKQSNSIVTVQSEQVTIISSEPFLPWLAKKQLPIEAVAVTVKHPTNTVLKILTAVPAKGQP